MKKLVLVSLALVLLPLAAMASQPTDRFDKVANKLVNTINDENWPASGG